MENTIFRSKIYDDIYFSTDDGLLESKVVFLDGIGAPDCWKEKKNFTICELGFGTGLNFLNTVKLWLQTTTNSTLHYIATEKHLLSKAEIIDVIDWPELQENLDQMLQNYPAKKASLFDGRVTLELLLGDSYAQLSQTVFKADAWYLDGFAPAKNPDMWSEKLLFEIAQHSNREAKLATFTAAGFVRRGLMDVGFQMEKRAGFGKKREMLVGRYAGNSL